MSHDTSAWVTSHIDESRRVWKPWRGLFSLVYWTTFACCSSPKTNTNYVGFRTHQKNLSGGGRKLGDFFSISETASLQSGLCEHTGLVNRFCHHTCHMPNIGQSSFLFNKHGVVAVQLQRNKHVAVQLQRSTNMDLLHFLRNCKVAIRAFPWDCCDMAHSYVKWLTYMRCDRTHSYMTRLIHMWRDSFICDRAFTYVTWLISICHDSFIRDSFIREITCAVPYAYVTWLIALGTWLIALGTWLIEIGHDSITYHWYDSFIWDMTHSNKTWLNHMRHHWFICVTWHIRMWHASFIWDVAHSNRTWLNHNWHPWLM